MQPHSLDLMIDFAGRFSFHLTEQLAVAVLGCRQMVSLLPLVASDSVWLLLSLFN